LFNIIFSFFLPAILTLVQFLILYTLDLKSNLVGLNSSLLIDLDHSLLLCFPFRVKIRRVILSLLTEEDSQVIRVDTLVDLQCSIHACVHFLLSMVYQGLYLLLRVSLAIELILKEALHLEVGVRSSAGITSVAIVGLTVASADSILVY
jgi:hypothetical protein